MKNFVTTALLTSAGLLLTSQSFATTTEKTARADFQVKIEVLSTCAITATDIDFGSINSASTATDKTGALNVTCTNKTPYTVGLSGSGKMTHKDDATAVIAYELFQKASDKSQWDNTSNKLSNTGTGDVQTIPVVAKVSGSTNVRAGQYADKVTATVTY